MNRVIVFLLAAFDALVTVAAGVAVVLAPATLVWVVGFGGAAPWDALWPTAATVWQLGHVVPLEITLPADYVGAVGIDPDAATFTLSLAPLAFAAFAAVSAARSGRRASRSGAAFTGAAGGALAYAAAAAGIALTAGNQVAATSLTEAILFPALVFAVPALLGAIVTEWQDADRGLIAAVRERVEDLPEDWSRTPTIIVRTGAIATVGIVGVAALATAVAIFARGSQIVGLYEASHVDVLGAVVLTLGQLLYLPTLIVWALAFVAGPGVSLGVGSTVAPSGTTTGVLPGRSPSRRRRGCCCSCSCPSASGPSPGGSPGRCTRRMPNASRSALSRHWGSPSSLPHLRQSSRGLRPVRSDRGRWRGSDQSRAPWPWPSASRSAWVRRSCCSLRVGESARTPSPPTSPQQCRGPR